MKVKSNSSSRLKYVSFTDQIAKVSVDIARWHSSITAVTSAENETYFNDTVTKYRDLDYGSYFENFLNDIPYFDGELRTYAQLLHQKDIVAKALINHLNISESTSLGTLLKLTIAFVQDIREDFRSYIWDFIEAIISILERSHEDKEILETVFFTLAKIFWLQRRHLVCELHEVFSLSHIFVYIQDLFIIPVSRRFKRIFCCKRSYLRRFTAEALAFLLRKSSAVGNLAVFLAETACNEIDNSLLIDGISRLYFNALKITRGQFHSASPQLLSEILQASLEIEENDVRNIAIQILVDTIRQCSSYTSKECSELLVDVILRQYKSTLASFDTVKSSALANLLNAWISQKRGRSLHKPSSLFQVIIDGVKSRAGKVERETVELLTIAIMRYHGESELHVLITAAVRLLMNNEQSCGFDVILDFLYNISDIPLFDIWIMPIVGAFMSRLVVQEDAQIINGIFRFYADICNKRRPIWKHKEKRNCFFDTSNHLEVRNRLIDILKSSDNFDAEIVGCCLMTYPWLWSQSENPKEIAAVFRILVASMSSLDNVDARLSLLAANACFLFDPSLFRQFTLETLLKFYKNMGNNEAALRTLALILPFVEDSEKLKNISAMSKVANEILPMFGHWSSYVRQIALEVLTHFSIPMNNTKSNSEITVEIESVFDLLLRSERTPWTLGEYRTRLMILRQLTYGAHAKHMPQNFDIIPLRVIIGNLYEPFSIAWKELKNIIQDYAYGLNIDEFFSLFLPFLDHMELKSQYVISEDNGNLNCSMLDKMTTIGDKSPQNYGAFRLEMFRILNCISDLCERRTKLLSPLFIRFFRNEYQQGNLSERRESILVASSNLPCSADKDEWKDESNNEPKLSDTEKFECGRKMTEEDECVGRKLIRDSLITLLELFASFTSPKTIYMGNEIRDLYDELLMIADEAVQQRALKCIFTYNYKYVTPYREHLECLVQERTLISTLVKFSIDYHNSVIDSSHRADVMPIILRLLYGKCNIHCKRDITERRTAIFRFLAGSTSDELDFFFKLLFAPLLKVIGQEQSLEIFCKRTVSTFDASSMVSLQIIKGE
uniref:DRIM domain-containing protein n=1 Tax=Wuchereria bancrofti TaxID=6293 RepID=A0A1I8EDV8_WUCBA